MQGIRGLEGLQVAKRQKYPKIQATILSPPVVEKQKVMFTVSLDGLKRDIVILAPVIEEHALRRPMDVTELEQYVAANENSFLHSIALLAEETATGPIVIDRLEQFVI